MHTSPLNIPISEPFPLSNYTTEEIADVSSQIPGMCPQRVMQQMIGESNYAEIPNSSNYQALLDRSFDKSPLMSEAYRITSVDRNKVYGIPKDNHSRTAALWGAYISGLNGRPLDYRDVCWMNVLQKISRDVFCRKHDNLVDSVGYIRNIEMSENGEGR